jgi:hypothetical protein
MIDEDEGCNYNRKTGVGPGEAWNVICVKKGEGCQRKTSVSKRA